ncbi:MAG: glutathione S-transferase family protein [Sphingorhabdus sp.]
MITLYTQTTPNGRKPMVLMEELAQPYTRYMVNFGDQEQKSADFLALNPNGKIPVLVDDEGPDGKRHVVFESGAILIYLAEKFGSKLWPADPVSRSNCLQWLMFQMASVGPMIGQAGYFMRAAPEPQAYAADRFKAEVSRIMGVLNTRLAEPEYLAGTYTIADIATYPWIVGGIEFVGIDLAPHPNVSRWLQAMGARPAVTSAMAITS